MAISLASKRPALLMCGGQHHQGHLSWEAVAYSRASGTVRQIVALPARLVSALVSWPSQRGTSSRKALPGHLFFSRDCWARRSLPVRRAPTHLSVPPQRARTLRQASQVLARHLFGGTTPLPALRRGLRGGVVAGRPKGGSGSGNMAANAEAMQQEIAALQESITKQGDTVRSLKASLKEGNAEKVGKQGGSGV